MGSKAVLVEVEMKTSPAKVWEGLCQSGDLFPKLLPEHFKSFEVIQGDGISAGSVRLMKLYAGGGMPDNNMFAKQKIEEMDAGKRKMVSSIFEGELMKLSTVTVHPRDGDGSLVKYLIEVEKVSEEMPDPDAPKELTAKCFKELDKFLLKN